MNAICPVGTVSLGYTPKSHSVLMLEPNAVMTVEMIDFHCQPYTLTPLKIKASPYHWFGHVNF